MSIYIAETRKGNPYYNPKLASKYRIGFFIVRDSVPSDSLKFEMITPLYDLKKLKKGWNSFKIDSCYLNSKYLVVGFGLVLKPGESDVETEVVNENDNKRRTTFESPLFVKCLTSGGNYYYHMACYGQNIWSKNPGELMLHIETKE